MENNKKQNYARSNANKTATPSEANKKNNTDLQASKPWPKNTRRQQAQQQFQAPRNEPSHRPTNKSQQVVGKSRNYADKRPRARASNGGSNNDTEESYYDGAACSNDDLFAAGAGLEFALGAGNTARHAQLDYELNSVYAPGSKKQNLNHLLNFHYAEREPSHAATTTYNVFGRGGANGKQRQKSSGGGGGIKHKYNKEQFVQANFQFVIKSNVQPKHNASPDTLIDWQHIEQINISSSEEAQCPICLYPPIAAKLTRCGHVYCWPCILHYLALSEKSWRKCPICYEAIHIGDLKSTTIKQQRDFGVSEEINFHLMRRKKGSMFIEKFKSYEAIVERFPQYSWQHDDDAKLFSKFVIAKRADIAQMIERERRELIAGEDVNCPDYVFIQQALDLLKERREKLGDLEDPKVEAMEKPALQVEAADAMPHTEVEQLQDEQNEEVYAEQFANNEIAMKAGATSLELETADANGAVTAEAVAEIVSSASNTKYYYFYQCVDGQNIYLHPMNVKMLQACYGTLDRAPHTISARIIQNEQHTMDEEHRRKFTCLGHLPLTCQFSVVEVELQAPVVSTGILKLFKDDIINRQKERQRRAREERKRERHINDLNDRQMGKLIANTANLNLSSSHEFPTCGFEDFPSVASFSSSSNTDTLEQEIVAPKPKHQASYSTVTVAWGDSPRPKLPQPAVKLTPTTTKQLISSENDTFVSTMQTNLSDVLEQAMSQKKQKQNRVDAAAGANSKKSKKSKKMLPIFTTGMSYNGN